MINIVLYEPEIPANTGNIIRLCANTGAQLHLVQPLGFELDNARLKRAGLDYHEYASLKLWDDWSECLNDLHNKGCQHFYAMTTKSNISLYDTPLIQSSDEQVCFLFGPETRGLPKEILEIFTQESKRRLPMQEGSRSLNLSNSVAIVLYEAWRQKHFLPLSLK